MMRSARRGFRPALAVAAGALVATMIAAPARDARADEVSPTGKGITGGALMGAESVTIVASIAGLRTGWVYGVAAALGAAGGGIGGYFVEQGSTDGVAPTAMLAGGLALIIPAVVLYLNGTRYQPEEGAAEDHTPAGPPAEPGVPGAGVTTAPPSPAAPPPPPPPTSAVPQSILDFRAGAPQFGVPVPELRRTLTVAEERLYGTRSSGELRVPVLHVVF
jgi:hypothetical protein